MIEKISYAEWNCIKNKDDEVDVELNHNDIVYKINDLYCACETTNECNNIMIYSDKYSIKNIKSMLMFIYLLGTYEDIHYITVNSALNRYRLFKKLFHSYGAFFPPYESEELGTREEMVFKLDDEFLNLLYKMATK